MNDSKLNLFLLGLTILVLFFAFYYDRKDKQERLKLKDSVWIFTKLKFNS